MSELNQLKEQVIKNVLAVKDEQLLRNVLSLFEKLEDSNHSLVSEPVVGNYSDKAVDEKNVPQEIRLLLGLSKLQESTPHKSVREFIDL